MGTEGWNLAVSTRVGLASTDFFSSLSLSDSFFIFVPSPSLAGVGECVEQRERLDFVGCATHSLTHSLALSAKCACRGSLDVFDFEHMLISLLFLAVL